MQRKKHEKTFLLLPGNIIRYHEINNINNDIHHSPLSNNDRGYSLITV